MSNVEGIRLTVRCDADQVLAETKELALLLQRLPDALRNSLLERLADLPDFGLQTEFVPASEAGSFVFRLRSGALAEVLAAARRALDIDLTEIDFAHGEPFCGC